MPDTAGVGFAGEQLGLLVQPGVAEEEGGERGGPGGGQLGPQPPQPLHQAPPHPPLAEHSSHAQVRSGHNAPGGSDMYSGKILKV